MPRCSTGGLLQTASLVALLEQAGVSKSSLIHVTGPSALSAMLWLCRHGYEQVGYVRSAEGWPCEEPEAILVAHTCGAAEFPALLNIGRQVRPGGAFIFQLRSAADGGRDVDRMLQAAGFCAVRRFVGERRALIIARRMAVPLRQAA